MISEDSKIGHGTKIWHPELVNIYGAVIGEDCNIGSFIEIRKSVVIGNRVRIQAFSFIPEGVTIEDDVFIGPHVCFTNDKYPNASNAQDGNWECLPTTVKKGSAIGANATILPGVTIGAGATVGAGAVVTRDVPDGATIYGNPAAYYPVGGLASQQATPSLSYLKVLVCVFAYNEGLKLEKTVERFPLPREYDVMVMDDGSTDQTSEILSRHPEIIVLRNEKNHGVGYSMRRVFQYAVDNKYDVVIPYAGNNKDRPEDIPALLTAVRAGYDLVQGSRYIPGGMYGNMPFYRQLATRFMHPWIFSMVSGMHITDSTNGFRAIRTSILKDDRIDLSQNWLDQYELEPYLFIRAIQLGFRVTEVPVTKIYPEKGLGKYTKMKPLWGWWSILRPLIYLWWKVKS